jgi:Flp pilus assembly protein TadD/uncharacterized caspase-like protein
MFRKLRLPFITQLIIVVLFCNGQIPEYKKQPQPEQKAETGNTYAIIIGIANYEFVTDLQFADKDARAFAGFLMSKTGGSVNEKNIRLLTNQEANSTNIGDAFRWVLKVAKPGDRVYFFFAGHGDEESLISLDNGLLLLHRAPKDSYLALGCDYLKISDLRIIAEDLTKRQTEVIIITDACHSGNLAGGETGIYSTSRQLKEVWENSFKVLSCQSDELSYEGAQWGGGHGVFSYYLVLGMGGLADKDQNNEVNLMELRNYLETEVPRETAPSSQTPQVVGNIKKNLTIVDTEELIKLKTEHENQIKMFSYVNTLSSDEIFSEYLQNQNDTLKFLYSRYLELVKSGNLIEPENNSAYLYFKKLKSSVENETLNRLLERNFIAALQDKGMSIIIPILELKMFSKSIEEIDLGAKELSLAMELLGEKHYMYKQIQIRKMFLEAFSLSQQFIKDSDSSKLVQAETGLLLAMNLDYNAAYPYFQLGWIYLNMGQYKKGLKTYRKYQQLVPNNPRAYNNLGYAYNELKQYDSAIINFRKVITLDSTYSRPYNNIGFALAIQEKYDESVQWFRTAISKDSSYQRAYYNLGNSLIKLKKLDEAETNINKATELNPNDYDSWYNLACIYSLRNKKEKALEYLEKSIQCGLDNKKRIEEEADFAKIRETKEFIKLLKSLD